MNRLHWIRMNDLEHAAKEQIVLRVTYGDSEFIDCSKKKYKLIIKEGAWENYSDLSNALSIIDGKIPDPDEPGRIVFDLPKESTDLNTTRSRYYCRIIETAEDGKSEMKPIAMGYFRVVPKGDKYQGGQHG